MRKLPLIVFGICFLIVLLAAIVSCGTVLRRLPAGRSAAHAVGPPLISPRT